MKWPLSLTLIRHGESECNILHHKKESDPEYREYAAEFQRDHTSPISVIQAGIMRRRYTTNISDYDTALTEVGKAQAEHVGFKILGIAPEPDVIFVSPYKRTRDTLEAILKTCTFEKEPRVVVEDRIREQGHGLALVYNDRRVFQTFHPEQKKLYDLQGEYWYQYPQGESVSMVRDRIRSFLSMLIREYAKKHIWVVLHHLTKLSIRANLERLSPEQFVRIDREEKPINCGVTVYRGDPEAGTEGKLILEKYNHKLYY